MDGHGLWWASSPAGAGASSDAEGAEPFDDTGAASAALGPAGPARGTGWLARIVRQAQAADGAGAAPRVRHEEERARVPGGARGVTAAPGGGVVHFARSSLRVRVARGGAVFCGWDGTWPDPSCFLPEGTPETDDRVALEPDTKGGWRVVSERVTIAVSSRGAVEMRTPGGALLRRDAPPRWWEPHAETGGTGTREARGEREAVAGGERRGRRWVHRAEVPADAVFLRAEGAGGEPALADGTYRLGRGGPGAAPTLRPPALVVAGSAGTHLVFHDNDNEGALTLRSGHRGDGSGHDLAGSTHLRVAGGALRYWVLVGTPSRPLRSWAALTGGPGPAETFPEP